jgi:hypothetical protein
LSAARDYADTQVGIVAKLAEGGVQGAADV